MFKQITQELIQSGLTEVEIAKLVDCNQSTINRIRNGKQEPNGHLALKLVDLRKSRSRFLRKAAA